MGDDFLFTSGCESVLNESLDYGVKRVPAKFPLEWTRSIEKLCLQQIERFSTMAHEQREASLIVLGFDARHQLVLAIPLTLQLGRDHVQRQNFCAFGPMVCQKEPSTIAQWQISIVEGKVPPKLSQIEQRLQLSVPQKAVPWRGSLLLLLFIIVLSAFIGSQLFKYCISERIPTPHVVPQPHSQPETPKDILLLKLLPITLQGDLHVVKQESKDKRMQVLVKYFETVSQIIVERKDVHIAKTLQDIHIPYRKLHPIYQEQYYRYDYQLAQASFALLLTYARIQLAYKIYQSNLEHQYYQKILAQGKKHGTTKQ